METKTPNKVSLSNLASYLSLVTGRPTFEVESEWLRTHIIEDTKSPNTALVWCLTHRDEGMAVIYDDATIANIEAVLSMQTVFALAGICNINGVEWKGVFPMSEGATDEEHEEVKVATSSRVH